MDVHLGRRFETLCNICLRSAPFFYRYEEDGRRICDAFVIGVAGTQTFQLYSYLFKGLNAGPSLQAVHQVARSNAFPTVGPS